jgi:DNA end-binding protein Ku
MASARPFWKGYLKLSLISCPIALFPASSSSERVSFRQISKKTGHRLKQQLVDSVTGEVVGSGDRRQGTWLSDWQGRIHAGGRRGA